jgi:glycosyltransferase involved in cell wall biosynthesis
MKICVLGKYPPIQGGVSTSNYWLSKALGEQGQKVFVVTNAEEASFEYREEISPREAKWLEPHNVKVINTYPLNRKFIPQYPAFVTKLASLAIDVIKKEKVDVLYSNYLLPYGVAAYIVKQVTGVPWFLDHAGSDITNLFDEALLQPIFIELFKKADLVVNSFQVRERLIKTGIIQENKISPLIGKMFYAHVIDKSFSASAKPFNLSCYFDNFNKRLPVFTYLGKISPMKKTFSFVEAASFLPKRKFYLLFVTEKGSLYIQLKNLIAKFGLKDNSCIISFQPPWRIPSIITVSTCIVAPESEETPSLPEGTHASRICFEAMLCGRCAIIGEVMSKKVFYAHCKDKEHFLVVNPHNIKYFTKKLKLIVDNPFRAYKIGKNARKFVDSKMFAFNDSVIKFIQNLKLTIIKANEENSSFKH